MANSATKIDRKLLSDLEPLNRLSAIDQDELAAKSVVETVPAGRVVFRNGEKDQRYVYLLSGQVELIIPGKPDPKIIKTKTPLSEPLAQEFPRPVTLKTKTACSFLYIDADLLEFMMSDGLDSAIEVTEIDSDDSDDWMLTFLQSPAFLQLPTENIQQLLVRMEEMHAKKGQLIIQQGATDDFYYIIRSGSCDVTRKPYADAAEVPLAILPTGSGFGEEALITNSKRNASVRMRENGILMRLNKKDFHELLVTPLIKFVDDKQANNLLQDNSIVIDVRSQEQINNKPVPGAVNIPMTLLRLKFDNFNNKSKYLIVCQDGSQSASAAFLMSQRGLNCYVLKGGLEKTTLSALKDQSQKRALDNQALVAKADAIAKEQIEKAKQQAEKIAQQAQQVREARLKAEQEIQKHKHEIDQARQRAQQESRFAQSAKAEASKLKAEAEAARKQAEQELAMAKAEAEANRQRQTELDAARLAAENLMKQSAEEAEKSRRQALAEAEAIRRQAEEDAARLKAEVEMARKQIEQEAAQAKEKEHLLALSAEQVKREAEEIRREAMQDAERIRHEIEATRIILKNKLKQAEVEESRKREAVLAEARQRAAEVAQSQTLQAQAEAEAIRQQARQEAERLNKELENTRKQIEQEAARAINLLKQQAESAQHQQAPQFVIQSHEYDIMPKPSATPVVQQHKVDDESAKRKAEAIKAKLNKVKPVQVDDTIDDTAGVAIANVRVRKVQDRTILEGKEDIFIFKEPSASVEEEIPVLEEQVEIPENKPVKNEQAATTVNPFLKPEDLAGIPDVPAQTTTYVGNPQKVIANQRIQPQTAMQNTGNHGFKRFALAASVIMAIAGTILTLHVTDTVKVQSMIAFFTGDNSTDVADAKGKQKKTLQAGQNVKLKEKASNSMDGIVDGWKNLIAPQKKK